MRRRWTCLYSFLDVNKAYAPVRWEKLKEENEVIWSKRGIYHNLPKPACIGCIHKSKHCVDTQSAIKMVQGTKVPLLHSMYVMGIVE